MLQNAYLLAKIGDDTAENERNFAKKWQMFGKFCTRAAGVADHRRAYFTLFAPWSNLIEFELMIRISRSVKNLRHLAAGWFAFPNFTKEPGESRGRAPEVNALTGGERFGEMVIVILNMSAVPSEWSDLDLTRARKPQSNSIILC